MNGSFVKAVSCSPEHGTHKNVVEQIVLVEGKGVQGDAHFGTTVQHRSRVRKDPSQPNLRQVHLIGTELHEEVRSKGFHVVAGSMGENILTTGIDLLGLPTDTELCFDKGPVIRVTGLRNPCQQLNDFIPGLMQAVLDRTESGELIRRAGVMGVVVRGGIVTAGATIETRLPPAPHRSLKPV